MLYIAVMPEPGGQILPTLYYWYLQKFSPSGITAVQCIVLLKEVAFIAGKSKNQVAKKKFH
jgi:hypothetical protein